MFNRETLDRAFLIAMDYHKRGNVVVPKNNNNPITMALAACNMDLNLVTNQASISDVSNNIIEMTKSSLGLAGFKSKYDEVMDSCLPQLQRHLQAHLNYLRSVVIPYGRELYERTFAEISSVDKNDFIKQQIEIQYYPEMTTHGSFLNDVRQRAAKNIETNRISMPELPDPSNINFKEYIMTGNAGLDELILEWAASQDENYLDSIYTTVFQNKDGKTSLLEVINSQSKLNNAFAVYLIGRAMRDKPLEGAVASADRYKTFIDFILGQTCYYIMDHYRIRQSNLESKRLVINVKNNVCLINGDLYDEWLENGGDADLITANAMLDKPFTTVTEINNNIDVLRTKWEHANAAIKVRAEADSIYITKRALRKHFMNILEEELSKNEITQEDLIQFDRTFNRMVDYTSVSDIADLSAYCVSLVAKARFSGVEADIITGDLHKLSKEMGLEAKEAATQATLYYVAQWAANLLEVKKRSEINHEDY